MTTTDFGALVNPTRVLPPVKSEPSAEDLVTALCHLGQLYSPSSLNAKAKLHLPQHTQELTENEDYTDAVDSARVDESERRYAMSWITRLIASGIYWAKEQKVPLLGAEGLLDLAGRVLGGQACIEEAGAIVRDFTFPLPEPVMDGLEPGSFFGGQVHISLRDDPLPPSIAAPDDEDGQETSKQAAAAVGVQTWAAAIIMSDLFVRRPDLFHPWFQKGLTQQPSMRIGELGAGTGLVGMTAAKMLEAVNFSATITMSDYHDQVLANLRHNLGVNFSSSSQSNAGVEKVDWQELHQRRLARREDKSIRDLPAEEQYHLLLLADVIYSSEHAVWLHSSISELLLKEEDARAHIAIALRTNGKFEGLYKSVEHAFGSPRPERRTPTPTGVPSLLSSLSPTPLDTTPGTPSVAPSTDTLHSRIDALRLTEPQLEIFKITRLEKKKGRGRPDETGYLWFEIGWSMQ